MARAGSDALANTQPAAGGGGWDQFRRGLVEPSGLSLVIALAAASAFLIVFFTLLVPGMVRDLDPGYWATSGTDHDAFTTAKLLNLSASEERDLLIAIIGASVTRSSFGTEKQIETAFTDRYGFAADVENLSTSRQSLWEHLAILRTIAGRRPTIAIVGIGPIRFTADEARMREIVENPRLGIRLPGLDEQAVAMGVDPPRRTGLYAVDNWGFLIARLDSLAVNLRRGPIRHDEQPYLGREKRDWDAFAEHSRLVAARLKRFDANFDDNLAVLDSMQQKFGSRDNLQLAFVEHPVNPDFVDHFMRRGDYEDYLQQMQRWSAASGANYWRIALDQEIGKEHYFDWAHIRTAAAKERMRDDLIARLEPLLSELEVFSEAKKE